jgi:CheY-specific phosphatase CheX
MDADLLLANTQTFAQAVRDCFRDMLGTEIVLEGLPQKQGQFAPAHHLIVMIHFTGPVQGEYVISMAESTAAGFLGAWREGMTQEDLKALRSDFGGMLKEILNTAVGVAIPHLEATFDRLTYHPPMVVYGELEYPDVPCGTLTMATGQGEIQCSFVLDMAGTEAERMLVRAMDDLRQAKHQVESCYKVLHSLVEKPPEGNQMRQIVEEARHLLEEFAPQGSDPTTQGRW